MDRCKHCDENIHWNTMGKAWFHWDSHRTCLNLTTVAELKTPDNVELGGMHD
ncbi:hypothetical protein QCN32_gp83 [Arthrobacter phage Niktson]|uniref:Uncharacterized protein n=1 Tax=Arthrobacter phage Niktson TaxID=2014347 RepID=A0A218M5Q2_9CAUD|nr:hypothetical protein QCN32_gp83 [Arthrobacter phage Niktson]ASD52302.1 hypothetical protein NIKTSON_83 [Arthrobacter phage Niktson]ASD52396.1 hypothetical protein ELEPHANTMAN_83 [Arthrobacter phage ElephantMan]